MNKQQVAAKNYLMRAYRIDTRINSKLEQIQSLNDLATKATSVISDMPGNATHNVHKTEDVIVKIVDLQNEIKEAMEGLVDLKKQILDSINKVEDPELRTLLELRYISYMSWENIASEMFYGIDNVFKLHRKALEQIEVPVQ
ncbi:MAG: DUF1492 domain-containing protein [Lachnospiraceae bacterium]